MNSSVFGKTMEDVEKHIDIRLDTDSKKYNKLVANSDVAFDQNLVAVHLKKTKVV